ncbi:hypothetical protein C0J52_14584 [Blattella germanica]|nr:hypothetical protein C0J52_14584 [Blattella germanica]
MESGTVASTTSSTQSSPRFSFRGAEADCDNLAEGDEVHTQEESPAPRFWRRLGDGDQPEVLDPDHPLMKRFQTALKSHLERQYNRLNEEVLELEAIIKKQQVECEDLGVNVYDMQQEVGRQQGIIDTNDETLSNVTKMREEMDIYVEDSRKVHKIEQKKLHNARKKEEELRAELDSLMNLERQFLDWEQEMENELAVSERIAEKTKIDKRQLTEEMQKQDILILKLMNEIANLESKLVSLQGQFQMKEAERNKVSQAVADANADLESLRLEQHHLVQSWNSVVILIQQRDKAYTKFMTEYSEIEGLKKLSNDEMMNNERLTLILNKGQMEEANLQRLAGIEEEKKHVLENQLSGIHGILEQTDKDIERVTFEYHKLQHEDKLLQNDVEKLSFEKIELEEKIIITLQEQITQDKAAKYLNRVLRTLRAKSRDHEMTMVNTENQLTKTSLEAEYQKGVNDQSQVVLDELMKKVNEKDKELDNLELELNRCKSDLCRKQGPLELKILTLEKNIADTSAKSEKLQQFWLRQQSHLIELANQRNEQVHNIDLMRKQVLIMSQKNLKIEYEIDQQDREEQKVKRSIENLSTKLLSLNLKLYERRGYKENLDKENLFAQNQYLNILKDAEMAAVKLQCEIEELEQDKVNLGETLLEKQRDYLAWEKKFQMAQETKENTDRERSKEGEVGNMKAEIHRMQVRYSQLRKAQEKLIGDLENCVARRDAIADQTEARERKTYKGSHKTRHNFQKNLENIRTKTKQVNSVNTHHRKEELIQQMKEKEEQLQQLQDSIRQLELQLEEGQLQRQKNLETIVRRQRKARMYTDVKSGRYRLLFRSENALDNEFQKQRMMNSDLTSMLESLLVDFPALKYPLMKILNTVHLKPA